MALTCDLTLGKAFPFTISCILENGYNEQQQRPKRYLGNNFREYKLIVNVTALVRDEDDMKLFAYWWYNELVNGTENFYISLPIFGHTYDYEVKMISDFNTSLDNKDTRQIQMKLEVQDDIESVLETALEADFCGIV